MQNFLIVGTQRTGSSALGDGLGLHPDVVCGWEWTVRAKPWDSIRLAERALKGDFNSLAVRHQEHMAGQHIAGDTVLGFRKLFRSASWWLIHPRFSPALWLDRFEGYLAWLRRHPDIKIIHIYRSDNMAWLKSKALSRKSGRYFGEAYQQDLTAAINVNEAKRRILAKNWVDSRLSTLGETNPYIEVCYERFLENNHVVLSEVLKFLGCDPDRLPELELHMRAKPQSKKGTQDMLLNYAELELALGQQGLLTSSLDG